MLLLQDAEGGPDAVAAVMILEEALQLLVRILIELQRRCCHGLIVCLPGRSLFDLLSAGPEIAAEEEKAQEQGQQRRWANCPLSLLR